MLSSTLLSGLAADLRPATISIFWCHAYNRTELPSILYNIRHSHNINVLFMNPKLAVSWYFIHQGLSSPPHASPTYNHSMIKCV